MEINKKKFRWMLTAGKIIVGFCLILIIINRVSFVEFRQLVLVIDFFYFAVGGFFFCASMVLEVLKLFVLLQPIEDFFSTVRITLIGNFFNNFLPSSIGGDIYKIVFFSRKNYAAQGVLIVLLDRFIGLMLLLMGSVVVLLVFPSRLWAPLKSLLSSRANIADHTAVLLFGVVMLCLVLSLAVRVIKSLRWRANNFQGVAVATLKNIPPLRYFLAGFYSCGYHASRIVGVCYFLLAMGKQISLPEILVVMTFAAVLSALPLSIGALGIREGAFIVGFALFGVNYTVAAALALLVRLILLVPAIGGGGVLMHSALLQKKVSV